MAERPGLRMQRLMQKHEAERAAPSTGHDFLLGHVAVEWGVVAPAALVDCLREQQEARAKGDDPALGEILVRRKLVDDAALAKLTKECADRARRSSLSQRYELQERLGEGAMAVVYRAIDRQMGRPVALKLLRLPLESSDGARARFQREAAAAGALTHPNVVRFYDAGQDEGRTFLVMEYVDGRPLSAVLEERRPLRELAGMLEAAARGVHAAHQARIVHRDLKPANILVTRDGHAKVADFGLAYVRDSGLTQTGARLGTPLYMAPEQINGGEITPATDVWALGAILYQILTGRPPFIGTSIAEIYARIQSDDPTEIADAPRDLEAIARKAIAKDPARRYSSAEALADDLRRHLAGEPVHARPEGVAARWWRRARRHRALLLPALLLLVLAGIAVFWRVQSLTLNARTVADAERERRIRESDALAQEAAPLIEEATRALYREDISVANLRATAERARLLVDSAIQKHPASAPLHLQLGRILELLGRRDAAEAAFRKAVELDPSLGPARAALGRFLIEQANLGAYAPTFLPFPAEASQRFESRMREAVAHLERANAGGSSVQSWIIRTALAYARTDMTETARIAGEGIAACEGQDGVETLHWFRGISHEGAAGIEALARAVKLKPRYALALHALGTARLNADPAAARRDFSVVLELIPGFVSAHVNRANALLLLRELDAAEQDCNDALRLDPANPNAIYSRALARTALGRNEEALADLDVTIQRAPGFAKAWAYRARAKMALGDSDGALEDADRALAIDESTAMAHAIRASALLEFNDASGALSHAQRAIQLDPQIPSSHRVRARALLALGQLDAAREQLDALIAKKSDDDLLALRAEVLLKLHDFKAAIADCDALIRTSPTATAYTIRALARDATGNPGGALEDAYAAKKLNPTQAQARILDALLKRLEDNN